VEILISTTIISFFSLRPTWHIVNCDSDKLPSAAQRHMQVIWLLYHPSHQHYDALIPISGVDKVAVLDLQKSILEAAKQEARLIKLRAREVRAHINLPRHSQAPAAVGDTEDEDADAAAAQQLHQGLDDDGVTRELAAYLEGAPSVIRRRQTLVFIFTTSINM
jgi:hypothetical protein